MNRFFFYHFLVLLLVTEISASALDVEIHGKAAVLMNADTHKVLHAKEKDLFVYPASTTKVATALFVLETCPEVLSEIAVGSKETLATISPQAKQESNYRSPAYWLETDGCHMSIKRGEELVVKDLVYALLINSPNDAANVIAAHVGSSVPKFMERLNGYLHKVGLTKTHFLNPHGLHHPMHRTTAKEMALLTSIGVQNPIFRDIVCKSSYLFPKTNLEYERTLSQSNRLVKRGSYHYPYAIGVKTGTTKAAGKCLLAAAEKEGRLLVAALFGYAKREDLYGDAVQLFEAAFAEKKKRLVLLPEGTHPFKGIVGGKKRNLLASLPKGLKYDFYPSERESVRVHLEMDDLSLPVAMGARMGELLIKNEAGVVLGSEPIFAGKTIRPTLLASLTLLFKKKETFYALAGALFIVFVLRFRKNKQRRNRSRPLF